MGGKKSSGQPDPHMKVSWIRLSQCPSNIRETSKVWACMATYGYPAKWPLSDGIQQGLQAHRKHWNTSHLVRGSSDSAIYYMLSMSQIRCYSHIYLHSKICLKDCPRSSALVPNSLSVLESGPTTPLFPRPWMIFLLIKFSFHWTIFPWWALPQRNFCNDGNVLYVCCPKW